VHQDLLNAANSIERTQNGGGFHKIRPCADDMQEFHKSNVSVTRIELLNGGEQGNGHSDRSRSGFVRMGKNSKQKRV